MWIYVDRSLECRLALPASIGLALDYWLHLHSEDVHPFWSARPFGFRTIVGAIRASNGTHDKSLRLQIKHELHTLLSTSDYNTGANQPQEEFQLDGTTWTTAWLAWGNESLEPEKYKIVLSNLISSFSKAILSGNCRRIFFFARRLSAELSDAGWSNRQLFIRMKSVLCDSGKFSGSEIDTDLLQSAINTAFAESTLKSHTVTVSFAPVIVSKSFSKQFLDFPGSSSLNTEEIDSNYSRIIGASKQVSANSPEAAFRQAHSGFRRLIDILRVRHYIRTSFCGTARIEVEGETNPIWLEFPQPFWRKKGARRAIPAVPSAFNAFVEGNLTGSERTSWYAARWQLSQAFADWAEDSHEAAAKCWQALESFSPGKGGALARVEKLIPDYLLSATNEALALLATRASGQAGVLRRSNLTNSWFGWNSTRMELDIWIEKTTDRKSHKHWSTWQFPPDFLFDKDCGLFTVLNRYRNHPSAEMWMILRVEADFALLYGLRNKVVHTGERIFPDEVATYLGRTAVEVVLALMTARHGKGTEDFEHQVPN